MTTNFQPGDKVRVIDATPLEYGPIPAFHKGEIVTIKDKRDGYINLEEYPRSTPTWLARRFEAIVQEQPLVPPTDLVERDRVTVVRAEGTPWHYGQEVSIQEVSDGWVSVIGHDEHFWLASRFRRVVPEPQPVPDDDVTVGMTTPTRVVVVANDVDVNAIPRRSYDYTKGDRRFTRPDAAVEYAQAEFDRTGVVHVVRRDPGSYNFQELTLVQAMNW